MRRTLMLLMVVVVVVVALVMVVMVMLMGGRWTDVRASASPVVLQ